MNVKKLRVMVVDDSELVLEHVRFALERAGHAVSTRESALGTVSAVLKQRPDVLVLDISMPALDGDRLATVVSELRRDIVLILHSSRSEAELKRMATTAGANGYIAKTHDVARFLTEFHRIVFGIPTAYIALRT